VCSSDLCITGTSTPARQRNAQWARLGQATHAAAVARFAHGGFCGRLRMNMDGPA
jgi:hypothetical protein